MIGSVVLIHPTYSRDIIALSDFHLFCFHQNYLSEKSFDDKDALKIASNTFRQNISSIFELVFHLSEKDTTAA